jgi:hypothetical protein
MIAAFPLDVAYVLLCRSETLASSRRTSWAFASRFVHTLLQSIPPLALGRENFCDVAAQAHDQRELRSSALLVSYMHSSKQPK